MDLSIIIPTLNRAAYLGRTLQSILQQQHNGIEFEVIVVDNGSADDTREVCSRAQKEIDHFTYCFDDAPGMLTGRHRGAELASGNILSFIDDDVELNTQWLSSIVKTFAEHSDVSIVGGPSFARFESYPPDWLQYFWQSAPHGGTMCLPLSLLDMGEADQEIDPLYVFGLNYNIRQSAFRELGGFHPDRIPDSLQRYQGDGETGLSLKANMKKFRALYISSAFLYHFVPNARLQVAYFEKWHYYSGICNSYTQIRTGYNLYHSAESNSSKPLLPVRLLRKANRIFKHLINQDAVPKKIAELQVCFQKKQLEGYQFHQHAFHTDARVKEWVLQPDYWNYNLPA